MSETAGGMCGGGVANVLAQLNHEFARDILLALWNGDTGAYYLKRIVMGILNAVNSGGPEVKFVRDGAGNSIVRFSVPDEMNSFVPPAEYIGPSNPKSDLNGLRRTEEYQRWIWSLVQRPGRPRNELRLEIVIVPSADPDEFTKPAETTTGSGCDVITELDCFPRPDL